MLFVSIIFMLLVIKIGSLACPVGQPLCNFIGCYDPALRGCSNGGTTVQCINSCNGTSYANNEYSYNDTMVFNSGETAQYLMATVALSMSFPTNGPATTLQNSSVTTHSLLSKRSLWGKPQQKLRFGVC